MKGSLMPGVLSHTDQKWIASKSSVTFTVLLSKKIRYHKNLTFNFVVALDYK
jgi:hypothetical protein